MSFMGIFRRKNLVGCAGKRFGVDLGLSSLRADCLGESLHVAIYEIRRIPFLPHRKTEVVNSVWAAQMLKHRNCESTNSGRAELEGPNNCAWLKITPRVGKAGMEPQIWMSCVHMIDPIITERRQSYAWVTLNFHQIDPKFMSLSLLDPRSCSLSRHQGTHWV